MTEYRARRDPKRAPMHPGALLRKDVLPALGKNKKEIAKLLGVTRQTLHNILTEKQPVTTDMALRFGKLCGNGPTLWLNLQREVDLWKQGRRLSRRIARIPTLEVIAR
jgi:addiction module HigA family antidote